MFMVIMFLFMMTGIDVCVAVDMVNLMLFMPFFFYMISRLY